MAIHTPGFFRFIDRARSTVNTGEFTDYAVRSLILKEKSLYGIKLTGKMYDTGSPIGYQTCVEAFDLCR